MADAKITALTANTTPIGTDILPMVDDPGGTPLTQKVTIANLATVISPAASDTVAGIMEMAVQSEQETGTDVIRAVSPGRQQYHPSAAKVWVAYNQITPAILASYGVSSVTDSSTGTAIINFTTSFSSANYGVAGISGFHNGVTEDGTISVDTDGGPPHVAYVNITSHANSSGRSDSNYIGVGVFGDV